MKPTKEKIKAIINSNSDSKKIASVFISSSDQNQKAELESFIDTARKNSNQKKDFYLVLIETRS